MSDRDTAAGRLNLWEAPAPRWTQEEAIAFACARDYLAELQAVYAAALDELVAQPEPEIDHMMWLRSELELIRQQRRDLTVHDQTAVAEIRATVKARLEALRR
nr:hypothetical protein [uncultured Roseateles sp.]